MKQLKSINLFIISIITVACLMNCSVSHAQEKKFVEVMVSDTIMLNPLSFEYTISTGGEAILPQGMNYAQMEGEEKPEIKSSLMDIESLLNNNKFTYRVSGEKITPSIIIFQKKKI